MAKGPKGKAKGGNKSEAKRAMKGESDSEDEDGAAAAARSGACRCSPRIVHSSRLDSSAGRSWPCATQQAGGGNRAVAKPTMWIKSILLQFTAPQAPKGGIFWQECTETSMPEAVDNVAPAEVRSAKQGAS